MKTERAFGYEVEVEFQRASGKPNHLFHWRGISENAARRKGMMQSNALRIVKVDPVTREEWIQGFGIGSMRRPVGF
jgi:hypothetical protein